jgi:hypothetical protein
MHVRGNLVVPLEAGRARAAGIPGARFVALQSQNHLFLEHEPATERFFEDNQTLPKPLSRLPTQRTSKLCHTYGAR